MNNSISDWNLINYEKNALENILDKLEKNDKKINEVLNHLNKLETKVDNVLLKLFDNPNNFINKKDQEKEKPNITDSVNKGLKMITNDEMFRMRNNAWRQQSKIKLPGIINNSYITTPNIPINFNF
tara:strand:- start:388 stop:765 length:378 start_codon:yes stop_codon:yes gene_type:complete